MNKGYNIQTEKGQKRLEVNGLIIGITLFTGAIATNQTIPMFSGGFGVLSMTLLHQELRFI